MSSPQITPDQARFLFELTLPTLQNEHQTTKRVIESIPVDKGDYRPDPVSKTAMELAWHIAASEKRFFSGVCAGAFDFSPINRPETIRDAAGIAAWFDASFAANLEHMQRLSGEQLAHAIDFRGMFQRPAVHFLLLAQSHSVHHRGQLSAYLRPMGAKVPSIYGESYDVTQARLAKEGKAS